MPTSHYANAHADMGLGHKIFFSIKNFFFLLLHENIGDGFSLELPQ